MRILRFVKCTWNHFNRLGPLLLLFHIKDLNQAKNFCMVYNFADDTNLLRLSNSIKKLNKPVNVDLKHLVNWLNANKISFSVEKGEMVIFKSKQQKFEGDLKIKLCGKRLYPNESVEYLSVRLTQILVGSIMLMIFHYTE